MHYWLFKDINFTWSGGLTMLAKELLKLRQ